ncbi:DNA/RNA non-specific endonuclease [Nitrosopumilus ureiphilus]|uniref:Endonuclease n=1 Tax=Nitrosopumilus ureiphilus TaxID=1470067 RepID=A0A7D5R5K1_9ARCH|nr:DNA/RNA non-specific endonuclease [Nitrosopumilus ureiphilus]QLH05938.1 endonuclease [Nitrosopumilus ureiphilus]
MVSSSNYKKTDKKNKDKSKIMMKKLRSFIRTEGSKYLKDGNVSSIGIGYQIKDGKPTKEIAIQFTVKKKATTDMLESLNTTLLPESIKIGNIDVPTNVIEREFKADYRLVQEAITPDRKKRLDPILSGASVANVNETAGTIGCIVYDKFDGTPCILTNWHVLQGSKGKIGDEIVQPGPFDDNRTHLNRLGKLVRSHLGLAGDCAIATIEDRNFSSEIIDIPTTVEKLGEPELGDKVIKSGRTTGVTHGIVTRVDTISKLDYGGSVGEQNIGGFEIGLDPDYTPDNGEVSMGGDSGSVWIFKTNSGSLTNVMAGLHFAGEGQGNPMEYAIACYPNSIFKKLEISLQPPSDTQRVSGTGYDENFLSTQIPLPKLTPSNRKKMYKENGSEVIDYTHFSLALNKSRKFAFWVAWNIDGMNIRKVSRKGILFVLDSNIPNEFQIGNQLYVDNKLDRGHIARRADLVWGNLKEAKKANKDSFYFTNIVPQMDDFNRSSSGGLWGNLENAVFEDTDVEDLRVSVFGGPIFRDIDREYRGIKIPLDFWKVIAFVEDGKLKAKGFVLTQNLDELEALELDEFKVFQVALTEIEDRTGVKFSSKLKSVDSVGENLSHEPEVLSKRKPLESSRDIDWS